ncbi:MAG TPA: hypothetical protein VIS09_31285 [Streptomyces sp.]
MQPRPLLTVHGRTYEVSFRERQKHVRSAPEQPDRLDPTSSQQSTSATSAV